MFCVEVIHKDTKTKGKAFSAFIDLSKALDRVDHFYIRKYTFRKECPGRCYDTDELLEE